MALRAPELLAQLIANPTQDECILWPWGLFKDGAGKLRYKGKTAKAYRVAYEMHHGVLPPYLLHSCDVRACCNPLHLSPGTHLQNMHEMRQRNPEYLGGTLTAYQVTYIRTSDKRGMDLARELGVDQSTISKIRTGSRRNT